MKPALLLPILGLAAASATFVACDSQTTSDYQGEKLATIKGVVSNVAAISDAADLALLYDGFPTDLSDNYLGGVVLRAPVQGAFPSKFTLDLYEPPESEGLTISHAGQPDYAFVTQSPRAVGAAAPKFVRRIKDCIMGGLGAQKYLVLYLNRDLTPDDVAPYAEHGIPVNGPYPKAIDYFGVSKAGYHLLVPDAAVSAEGYPLSYHEAPSGFDTEITIELTKTMGPGCRESAPGEIDGGPN